MRKASLLIEPYQVWLQNKFFSGDPSFGFKTDIYHFVLLKSRLKDLNIDLSTFDINKIDESDILICFDQAAVKIENRKDQIKYLIIHDVPLYNNSNWVISNHVNYDKVFIWDNDVVDNKKYFYYTLPINIEDFTSPEPLSNDAFRTKKLCVTVSSIGTVNLNGPKDSLSPERYKSIKWFAENHPRDFVLYGRGWKDQLFNFRGKRILEKYLPYKVINFLAVKASEKNFFSKVYGGELNALEKVNKLKEYKFYLCYENTEMFNGWITEKIFDCFSASCVPIYWGPNDIGEYIPSNCYIDRKKFKSDSELYNYIINMSFERHAEYVNSIIDFWKSPGIEKFKTSKFVDLIVKHLQQDLKAKNLIQ